MNHPTHAPTLALVAALAVTSTLPRDVHADPPSDAPSREGAQEHFEGTWTLEQSTDEAERVVSRAVEDAANQFNFLIRGIARSRLREGTPIHRHVRVSFEGDEVTVAFGDERYTTTLGETEVRRNPEGEQMRVTQRIRDNGQLVQVFETEGGTRRYIYTPLGDGRIRIATTTDSPRMPQPMYFMLDYARGA